MNTHEGPGGLFESMLLSALETHWRERFLHDGVRISVPTAVHHAYEARRLGHCPRRPELPWWRCLGGAMALIRMYRRMAEQLRTYGSSECLEALDSWYEKSLDLQELN